MRRIDTTKAPGRIAGASVTGSYANLLANVQGSGIILYIFSTCDAELVISLDGGTTDWCYIPSTVSPSPIILPLGAANAQFSGTISVKHNGAAPTTGSVSASVIGIK